MFLMTLVATFLNFSFAEVAASGTGVSSETPTSAMSENFKNKFMNMCKSDRKSYFGKPSCLSDGKEKCIQAMCDCSLENASKISDSRKIVILGKGNADESIVITKIEKATYQGKPVQLEFEYGQFASIFEKECEANQQFRGEGHAAYNSALERLNSIEIVVKPVTSKAAPAMESSKPVAKPSSKPMPLHPPKREGMPPVRSNSEGEAPTVGQ